MRASIVVEGLSSVLKEINLEELNYKDQEMFGQVELLLERLHDIKIIDAPVLLKLYNLYRYQLVE